MFISAMQLTRCRAIQEYPSGELHRLIWHVVVRIDGYPYGSGADFRKSIARDQAAMVALMTLGLLQYSY